MIRHFRSIVTLTVLALGLGTTHIAQAQTAYALSNAGTTLVSFNLATPGSVTTIGNLGGATSFLNDIDFRPANGFLYGYSQNLNQIFTINTATAATTFISPVSAGSSGAVGIDFNPMADRLRIVTATNNNLRVNVMTGAATVDTNLSSTGIRDVAYTNNVAGATSTTIYYIDSTTNTLATAANPNTGPLTTVGALGVDPTNFSGFDIYTGAGGSNSAYAIIDTPAGANGLYSINLGTGAASLIGGVSASNINGFAIDPTTAPITVPEPGSIALFVGLTTVGAGFLRKRRARK